MADDAPGNPLSQMLGRLGLPTDQISNFQQQWGRMLNPTEQWQTVRDLLATFSPSMDQLETISRQLENQRTQLEAMISQLDEMEATLERLTSTAEQLRSMQDPFLRFNRFFGSEDE